MKPVARSVLIAHLTAQPSELLHSGQMKEDKFFKEMERIHALTDPAILAEVCVLFLNMDGLVDLHARLFKTVGMKLNYESDDVGYNVARARLLADERF